MFGFDFRPEHRREKSLAPQRLTQRGAERTLSMDFG